MTDEQIAQDFARSLGELTDRLVAHGRGDLRRTLPVAIGAILGRGEVVKHPGDGWLLRIGLGSVFMDLAWYADRAEVVAATRLGLGDPAPLWRVWPDVATMLGEAGFPIAERTVRADMVERVTQLSQP